MKKAVITSGGHQYIVAEKDRLEIDLVEEKKTLTFEPLLIIEGEKTTIGQPYVKGASVEAKIIEDEVKGEKVIAIRYKAKKRVHKTRGHRQRHAVIEITKIS